MNNNIRVTFFALLTIIPVCLHAQAKPQQGKRLPFDLAVHTGKLANGLTYYIRHNEEPKGRVYLYLVNKVGSILETEDQRGLAHYEFQRHQAFSKKSAG